MKISFARHGESQANTLRVRSNRGLRHPLTPRGRRQAAQLAEQLRSEGITRIFTSPLLRAIETSVVIAHALGIEYDVAEALREYDLGVLEGRAGHDAWQHWQERFDDWTKHRRWHACIAGGETFYDVRDCFVPFIDGLVRAYGHTDAHLLCVAHGGLYWRMLPCILQNVDTASIASRQGFAHTAVVVTELSPAGLRAITM